MQRDHNSRMAHSIASSSCVRRPGSSAAPPQAAFHLKSAYSTACTSAFSSGRLCSSGPRMWYPNCCRARYQQGRFFHSCRSSIGFGYRIWFRRFSRSFKVQLMATYAIRQYGSLSICGLGHVSTLVGLLIVLTGRCVFAEPTAKSPQAFRCLGSPSCAKYFEAAHTFVTLDDVKNAHHALYQAMGVCASAVPMPEYHCEDRDLIFYYAMFLHRKARDYRKAIDIYKRSAILFDAKNQYSRVSTPSVLHVIRDHIKEIEDSLQAPPDSAQGRAAGTPVSSNPAPAPSVPARLLSPANSAGTRPRIDCEFKNVSIHIQGDGVNFCGYTAPDVAARNRRRGILSAAFTSLGMALAVTAVGSVAFAVEQERVRSTAPPGTRDPVLIGFQF